jgi:hypothetical protein
MKRKDRLCRLCDKLVVQREAKDKAHIDRYGLCCLWAISNETPQQSSLLPPTLEELVPDGHLMRVVEATWLDWICRRWAFVGRTRAEQGVRRAALLKLYLYG